MILVNSRKTVLTFRSSGDASRGQYGLDTLSFKVIFEFAVPTAIVMDYSRLRPLRSPWRSYDPPGVCGDEHELRVRGFPGDTFATRVFELYVFGGLGGGEGLGGMTG